VTTSAVRRQRGGAQEGRGTVESHDDGGAGPADGHEAAAVLEESRAAVDPHLRSAIDSLPGSLRRVALHHFGWQHADGTPAAGNAGKAIRPALVLAAATALGGPAAR
jgi:geranylgeranyl diphosphate synthase, type I